MKCINLFFISILFFSCASANIEYETECISLESEGYVNIKVWSVKNTSVFRYENAQKKAINTILFSGTSGKACQTQPPLLKNSNEVEKFNKIKANFFKSNGKWSSFVKKGDSNYYKQSTPNQEYFIIVSKDELRKYLIEQKILKPLNNGF